MILGHFPFILFFWANNLICKCHINICSGESYVISMLIGWWHHKNAYNSSYSELWREKGNKLELCKSIYITPKQAGHWQKSLCNIITYLWFIKCFLKYDYFECQSMEKYSPLWFSNFLVIWFSLYIYCMLILEIFSTLRYNPPQNENSVIIYSPAVSSNCNAFLSSAEIKRRYFIGTVLVPIDFHCIFHPYNGCQWEVFDYQDSWNILKERHIV